MTRRHRQSTTRQLAEAGLFKQAVCSGRVQRFGVELDEVLALYNAPPGPDTLGEELKRPSASPASPKE